MNCYLEAKAGTEKEAVAVCAVCGMGLCMDHLTEIDNPPAASVGLMGDRSHMAILCPRCAHQPGTPWPEVLTRLGVGGGPVT